MPQAISNIKSTNENERVLICAIPADVRRANAAEKLKTGYVQGATSQQRNVSAKKSALPAAIQ